MKILTLKLFSSLLIVAYAQGSFCTFKATIKDANLKPIKKYSKLIDISESRNQRISFSDDSVVLNFSSLGQKKSHLVSSLSHLNISQNEFTRFGDQFIELRLVGDISNGVMGILRKQSLDAKMTCPLM